MFDSGRRWGWFIKSDETAKADFDAEVALRDWSGYSADMKGSPVGLMQKREIVSRDCGHKLIEGGSYRCKACGRKMRNTPPFGPM